MPKKKKRKQDFANNDPRINRNGTQRSRSTGANKRLKAEQQDDEPDRHSEPDFHQNAGEGAEDDALMDQLDDEQEANRHADLDEMEGGEDGDAEVGTVKKRGRGSLGREGRGWDHEVDEDMHDVPVDEIEEEEEVPPKPPTPPGEPYRTRRAGAKAIALQKQERELDIRARIANTKVGCDGQSSSVVSDLVKLLQLKPHDGLAEINILLGSSCPTHDARVLELSPHSDLQTAVASTRPGCTWTTCVTWRSLLLPTSALSTSSTNDLPQAPRRLRTQVKPADPVPMIKVGCAHRPSSGGGRAAFVMDDVRMMLTGICALHACMRLLEHLLRRVASAAPPALSTECGFPPYCRFTCQTRMSRALWTWSTQRLISVLS
ncbi:unnamed protein product [Vitrella brassicaformis CCMP3155]|uniref:Uncharacterized protein n=1 Tax=Vitrella brassicaformis (strain CCMP3155) TaxID=1169540 RepID=A0A0G4ESF8_VITBC|nr:unnamed protein product [Vitrella brassicaformis CCMP3155]|eukprot:CEM00926.1 unnamed protein product [Vitrella brassicaformis CCMP3155]